MDDSEAHGTPQPANVNENDDGKPYLLKCLLNFGFTPQVADTICQSISDELVDLQFPTYWAKRYIDSVWEHLSPWGWR